MVPTVSIVSPNAGHTGGRALVEITGTNFRLPDQLPIVGGRVPEAKPSVSVMFGTKAASAVFVASTTQLYAVTPKADAATVDVIVTNLDANGAPIGGETVTVASAYTFARPNVTDGESDLVRVIAAFVDEVKRQVSPNVLWPQNTDFDSDTGDLLSQTEVPSFPHLIIAATDLDENKFYAVREPQEAPSPTDPNGFVLQRPPTTVDIVITIVGVSNNSVELLNLGAVVRAFFKKNPYLEVDRDPAHLDRGTVQYEMDAQDAPDVKVAVGASKDNVKSFAVTARIRGFDIEEVYGVQPEGPSGQTEATIDIGKTADTVTIEPTVTAG